MAEKQNEILGYIILNCVKEELLRGYILDLHVLPTDYNVFNILLNKSIDHLMSKGAGIIHCWMLDNTPYYKWLQRSGFRKKKSQIVHFCGLNLDKGLQEQFTNYNNWFVCQGDEDGF